ncbi:amidophosphoribosyltransferase [Caldicoprobacter algeriensis]|uniref:amidophosphoribosyltransferase n=1 Tax=Caldicoprobacter algeriensis TaxID=699281 RepID=UPI00207A4437|nr:amidophosphoribosyltransferase [Caldicoprobacter algeriensis]MCM8899995.1 amidophosphoribosyltransferase [Caldicoprobacter algeriensis]
MHPRDLLLVDKLNEECGVFGIFDQDGLAVHEITYYGLYALQHRGQESAGIAVADGYTIRYHKGMGLVPEVFDEETLGMLKDGRIAIGHVRYPTYGDTSLYNAQPLVIKYKKGFLALAHNGNLVNAEVLRNELEDAGAVFQTSVDSEVIANLIARHIDEGLETAIQNTMSKLRGAYALLLMTEDKLIAVRDPYGMRPLALGRIGHSYVVASESCAFDAVDAEFIRDVKPGEILIISQDGLRSIQTPVPLKSALCVFEFIYFARTDSTIDGVSVYTARKEAGKILAAEHPVDADLVIGVPDSGTTAALGYAEASGIPFGEGLIKNRYVGRTFIKPSQAVREQGVRIKLNALRKIVKGKRIVMIDDSIVRGTTSKKIVEMLRLAGAREVHMRISSPPVRFPCYFGIDTPTKEHLIGAKYSVEEICRIIGADSLGYLSIEGLLKTVEGSGCDFCLGCFTGEYPMAVEVKYE